MVRPPPFQVRVVPSVELYHCRPLNGSDCGYGVTGRRGGSGCVRRRRRPPYTGRTGLGYGRRHRGCPRVITVMMMMLLMMVVMVMVVHVQIGWRVQARAGHGPVLRATGLGRLDLDVGHLQRLVVVERD